MFDPSTLNRQRTRSGLDPNATELTGALATIRFNGNGFVIGMLSDGTVIKGPMLAPQVGVEYVLTGHAINDPKWGWQFDFKSSAARIPTEKDAFASYLVANANWIGPVTAHRITEKYGVDSVRICREDPERVTREIKGITPARAIEIAQMLGGVKQNEELEIEMRGLLSGTGIGQALLMRILDVFKKDAPRAVRENPYQLIEKVDGVGFLKADAVALKVGYEPTGHFRLRAGVMHVLEDQAAMNGHICLPRASLIHFAAELLKVEGLSIYKEIQWLAGSGALVEVVEPPAPGDSDDLDGDSDGESKRARTIFYLPRLHSDERSVAQSVCTLLGHKLGAEVRQITDSTLHADQREAVEKATRNAVFILTGAPGTGKTYAIRSIIDTAGANAHIELAAPTGKAAKRIEEQTGIPARTMHRLLEPTMVNGRFVFRRGKDYPIEADMIVLDETSMVDITLMARFLEAVKEGTRLVLVGDVHQLPSVGPGNVLGELIKSGQVPSTELSTIKRQNPGRIIMNCHAIKDGKPLVLEEDWSQDFVFIEKETNDEIRKTIVDLVADSAWVEGVDRVRDVQVIVPLRERTGISAAAFNVELRRRLNPNAADVEEAIAPGYRPIVGDKVIQTRNDYQFGVMNGDVGRVVRVDPKESCVAVKFDTPERTVELPLKKNDLELAYALTCHKFQGSEARVVLVPVSKSYGPLVAQRNWAYTAVSRARDLLIMVGQRDEVPKIVSRNQPKRRYTRLARLIAERMVAV